MVQDRVAAIARTLLFCGLDETYLRVLAERRLAPDEVLFIAGEEARGFYIVIEEFRKDYEEI